MWLLLHGPLSLNQPCHYCHDRRSWDHMCRSLCACKNFVSQCKWMVSTHINILNILMWSHIPCKHQAVWVQRHTLGICILHVLVFDKSSLIYIDLLSQGPGLNLFSEVWATSMAALASPSSLLPHHLTLKFTDYCHRNVAIFTCLRRLFNGSVFPCTAITQQLQIIKGLRKGAVRVVHIGKLLTANLRPLHE